MKKYEFSRHSYDKLKHFSDVVDNNIIDDDKNQELKCKLKILFPQDTELSNMLSAHTLAVNDIIEIPSSPVEISIDGEVPNKSLNDYVSMDIGNPINEEIATITTATVNQETKENIVLFLEEMLDLQNEIATEQMLRTLDEHEQHLEYIFEHFKEHRNILNISKFIANYDNFKIVQVYCDLVLNKHILNGSEGVYEMLQDFFENHPQIMCSSLAKCLLVITDDHNLSKEFPDALLWISEANKANILETFLNECAELNKIQMKIVNNLMHEQMDLPGVKLLLSLLKKNVNNLSSDRYFGLLLQNLMQKSYRNLVPVKEDLEILLNCIQGILKLKLLKILKPLGQNNEALSETMQF